MYREIRNLFKRVFFFGARYIFSAFLFLFTLTVGIFLRKWRNFLEITCRYFRIGSITGVPRQILKTVRFSDICQNTSLKIIEPVSKDGNISLSELVIISALVKTYNPHRIFEIGTFNGRTTMNIAINSSKESEIFTLDLTKGQLSGTKYSLLEGEDLFVNKNISGERFIYKSIKEFPEKIKITQLYGDSASYNYKPYINSIDFVFIDGSHSYEYVLNDTNIALKLLRNGRGIILWHDYGAFADVIKALNKIQKNNPQFKLLHIENTSLVLLKLD